MRGDVEAPLTMTGTSLLEGLRDPNNRTVWREYVDRYRPFIVRYLRGVGLSPEDAEDLAQSSLLAFSESYRAGKYERQRGRLRSWLYGIVKNELRSHYRSRGRHPDPAPLEVEESARAGLDGRSDEDLDERWERECQAAVLRCCLRQIRTEVSETTYRAFELFALGDRSAEEAARTIGTTASKVYEAKRRVLARLRELEPLMSDSF